MQLPDTNLVILAGRITTDPLTNELPSGSVIYSWSLNISTGEAAATSVPVVAIDPRVSIRSRGAGDEVVLIGEVKRRFFRSGGATQSRTEVVAAQLVSARAAKGVSAAVDSARTALDRLT
jgi:single-strand DNA-binding protein